MCVFVFVCVCFSGTDVGCFREREQEALSTWDLFMRPSDFHRKKTS